jgi:hypothetical protein
MKHIKLFENFGKTYFSASLEIELTGKSKRWFENPEINNIGGELELKIKNIGELKYFVQKFSCSIDNFNDKIRLNTEALYRKLGDSLFGNKPIYIEYMKDSLKLANSAKELNSNLGGTVQKDYFQNINLNPGALPLDATILIGKGSLEVDKESNNYSPQYYYYATLGISAEEDFLIFSPRIIITEEYSEDDVIIKEVIYEIWGGGGHANTACKIDYDKLINKESFEDDQNWFRCIVKDITSQSRY